MTRHLVTACLAFVLAAVPARGVALEAPVETSGPALTSMSEVADGTVVAFEGELISEVLAGGDGHVWINVLSKGTGIGVWMPRELASDLEVFGDWSHTGDIVRVTGVLNEACDRHGGDLDVHASSLELVARGTRHERPWAWWKALGGLGGAIVAYVGYRTMRRQEDEPWE